MTKELNAVEQVGQEWLDAVGRDIDGTNFLTVEELGSHIINNDMSCQDNDVYEMEVRGADAKSGNPEIIRFEPDFYELLELREKGLVELVEAKPKESVELVSVGMAEFVVLSDSTVITRQADNSGGPDEAFWPYE